MNLNYTLVMYEHNYDLHISWKNDDHNANVANQETASVGTLPLGASRVTPSGVDCTDNALAGVRHVPVRGEVPLDSSLS